MPEIKFSVDGKTYTAHLRTMGIDGKRACMCALVSDSPMHVYSGITIKNPNDGMEFDENCGFHIAFKRALFNQYIIEKSHQTLTDGTNPPLKKVIVDWTEYFQNFRRPFGIALHNWYKEGDIPF